MVRKTAFTALAGILAVVMMGCWSTHSRRDVTRYLGRSQTDIIRAFGEPSGWCDRSPAVDGKSTGEAKALPPERLLYRNDTTTLPEPLTGLDFVLDGQGICTEIDGFTNGYDSPEALLAAVDLGHKVGDVLEQDDKAIMYEAPSLKRIEVYLPSRFDDRYSDFAIIG